MNLFRMLVLTALLPVAVFAQTSDTDDFLVRTLVGDDTTAPTVPTNLTATPVALTQIDLSWGTSTDNWVLSGYQVFRALITSSTTGSTTPVFTQIATTTATTYSDVGLTASTTYGYYVTAFDSFGNVSASSSIAYATTLAPSVPAPESDPEERLGGESFAPFYNQLTKLEVVPSQTSAVIRWQTQGYIKSVVRWGETSSYELGSLAERSFKRWHETIITGLEPGTRYKFTIEGENSIGWTGVITESSFTTVPPIDTYAPANVTGLRASISGDDVILNWVNPADSDFASVRVMRNDRFFPSDTADGWVVYEGDDESLVDTGAAIIGVTQYYTVFAYDELGNISSGAIISIRRTETGFQSPIFTPSVGSGDDSGTNTDSVLPVLTLDSLELSDIVFRQDAIELAVRDGVVVLDGAKQLTIAIPYERLPEHLKTITVVIHDAQTGDSTFSFLLRADEDKEFYTATVAPLSEEGIYPVSIKVYDYKTAEIDSIDFTLRSSIAWFGEGAAAGEGGFLDWMFSTVTNYVFWLFVLLLIVGGWWVRRWL